MRISVAALACVLVAACGGDTPTPQPIASISMEPAAWSINSQTATYGMPAHPTAASGGGWQVDLPVGAATAGQEPSLHSVLQPVSLKLGGAVTVVAEVQASADAAYWFATEATNPQPSSCPVGPHMRVLLQRAGDNLSGQGDYEFYRWWSAVWTGQDHGIELKPGTYNQTLTVQIGDDKSWIDVWGNPPSKDKAKFDEAMANVGAIGLTFGGGCAAGHGLRVTQGSARVVVRSFTAN